MKKVIDDIVDYLSSVRFTVVILIAIAILAAVGTVVGQNAPPEEYVMRFGHTVYNVLAFLSVTDIYHSIYFNALLMLLVTNITLCTLSFGPKRLTGLFRKQADRRQHPFSEEITTPGSVDEALATVTRIIRRPLCRTIVTRDKDGAHVTSTPYSIFTLGAIIVHISILMIIIGGLITSLFGFSGEMIILEGNRSHQVILDKTHAAMLDFSVQLDKFTFERYPDGTPKEYRSDITFIDGSNTTNASLTVNHPASYKGIRFYQTNYGKEMDHVTIEVQDRNGRSVFVTDADWSEPVAVPGHDLEFTVAQYGPDVMGFGPAVILTVREGSSRYEAYTFVNYPDFDREERRGDWIFILKDYYEVPFSSITAVREPGLSLVFIGFVLICIGFMFPIAASAGTFTVDIAPGDGKTFITVRGAPQKLKVGFDSSFKRRVQEIRKRLC